SSPALSTRRGGKALVAATVWKQVCRLISYAVLARLVGPTQLGLATTIVVTASFFSLASDAGGDRFLIQDRHGDEPEVQRLVQLVFVIRGVVVAAATAACAWPVAAFFRAPELVPAIMVLGAAPLISGFFNLDMRRVQRRHDFRAESLAEAASETAALAATLAGAFLLRSFVAVLFGLIARPAVMVAISHLRAERPYSLGFARAHAPRFARFAGPLMLNGFLLFLIIQGDRGLIGRRIGLEALGQYSAILLLIYYPSQVLFSYLHVVALPGIAGARDEAINRARRVDLLEGRALLLALGMSIGFAIIAPIMVPVLYGHRYGESRLIICLIGILQTSRFMVLAPNTEAMAGGKSWLIVTLQVLRLMALPAAILGAALHGGLAGVVIGFTAGELAALLAANLLLDRGWSARRRSLGRVAGFVAVQAALVGWVFALAAPRPAQVAGLGAVSLLLCLLLVRHEWTIITDGVDQIKTLIGQFRPPGGVLGASSAGEGK
ncbi:MAG: oligosaccharide flippase family protein, partial [Caulobacteraceae bacterium]